MISRAQAGVVLLAGLSISILGIVLFDYWMIPEEWMANILMSALFLFGSLWLTIIWALKVVFPFIKTTADSTVTEMGKTKGSVLRWILGNSQGVVGWSQLMSISVFLCFWHHDVPQD